MFDIGFSEILVIFVLALIVLGPEKLPRVVREVGRWVGRARAMARQFQEQLEEEVDTDRGRTARSEPVRPVGGVPTASISGVTPEPTEPVASPAAEPVPSVAAPWQTAAEPLPEAAASSGDRPAEALTQSTHERGT
jgi:sec-independent protein translocase protein TatB